VKVIKINTAFNNGEKYRLIPISSIAQLKNEIDNFKDGQGLNSFQKWIIEELYSFDIPENDFSIRSVILTAIPHPFYARVEFTWNNKQYMFMSLVLSDFDTTEKALHQIVQAEQSHIIKAGNLPLKRLAVQSGLGVYGRNNICYIKGMGSNFSLAAYYSDIPCHDDHWTGVSVSSQCTHCIICLRHCPTKAIQPDRFLIDNEKCLSYWNEGGEPFPAWIPEKAHHCIYDCLTCQIHCPMNKDQIKKVVGPLCFNEEETDMLLSGIPYEQQPVSLQQKVKYLGIHKWPAGIPRNLKTLFEVHDAQ
jgi:epoxyqueuosine reductase